MTPLAAELSAALAPLADPAKAAPMRAYMKDHFPFLGIPTPARRAATSPVIRAAKQAGRCELLETARDLWQQAEREHHYAALDLLDRHVKRLEPEDIEALLELARAKPWWDTVDAIATLVGAVLRRHRSWQARMDAAAGDPDMWIRRVAMLHQLGWRGDTDTARLFAYATRLAPEQEFFIRKAIGWGLRDYAHHDPDTVRNFLRAQRSILSSLTVREAGKHLGTL